MTFDAGYACPGLLAELDRGNAGHVDDDGVVRDHTALVRMPARAGCPLDGPCPEARPHLHDVV